MVICDKCGKATRVKHAFVEVDGKMKKVRVCKCGAVLDKSIQKAFQSSRSEGGRSSQEADEEAHRQGRSRRRKRRRTEAR